MKTKRFFALFLTLLLTMSLWATPQAAAVEDPNILAKAALLVDYTTGDIAYAKNEHEELYPASLTKIMTALLVLEALDRGDARLSDGVQVSPNAAAMKGSQDLRCQARHWHSP